MAEQIETQTTGARPDDYLRILAGATALTQHVSSLSTAGDQRLAERLRSSVVEPLAALLAPSSPAAAPAAPELSTGAGDVRAQVWELARAATALCGPAAPVQLVEATAALQDIACRLAADDSPEDAAARVVELAALQPTAGEQLRVAPDGPYLLRSTPLSTYLGEPVPTTPLTALCRCGQSQLKPTCDGACHRVGFSGGKDAERVPDRRDTYVGQQVTVLDNRGICQHSGLCTDRLATVFHLGEEPFVSPSGGRMDEIVRAVRDCPSGALSFALDGREAREQVDRSGMRDPEVEVTRDGPYRVTGAVPLIDGDGRDVRRDVGASGEHYALCRCGHSRNKPFCSGMHWYVEFHDPVPDPERTPTLFEWAGGLPALTRMTRLFYEKYVPADPMLGPVFANMSADHPQRVARWLAEVFGGPAVYSTAYGGYSRMIGEHLGKCLTEEWRARWVQLMSRSAQEAGLPDDPEFRAAFTAYLEWGSRLAVENSQTNSRPPAKMPMPRWDWGTAGPPGGRISALATPDPADEPLVVLPAPDEPVRFDKHIKPLFRARDRNSMRFAFDLWAYADVRANADAILARVRNGSMPCDGTWPADRIDTFARWMEAGKPA